MAVATARASVMARQSRTVRREYDALRTLTAEMVHEYDVAQRVLARAVGVRQPFISSVLKGRQISLPTLEGIVRAITTRVRTADGERLHAQLARLRHANGGPP